MVQLTTIKMIDHQDHSFFAIIPLFFLRLANRPPPLCCPDLWLVLKTPPVHLTDRRWSELKRIVDRVHKHTCGHASYSDMKSLLRLNKLWNPRCHALSEGKCYQI